MEQLVAVAEKRLTRPWVPSSRALSLDRAANLKDDKIDNGANSSLHDTCAHQEPLERVEPFREVLGLAAAQRGRQEGEQRQDEAAATQRDRVQNEVDLPVVRHVAVGDVFLEPKDPRGQFSVVIEPAGFDVFLVAGAVAEVREVLRVLDLVVEFSKDEKPGAEDQDRHRGA